MHPALAPFTALLLFAAALADGWLGVFLDPASEAAVVTGVVDGSPAQKAGIVAQDVIVAVNDTATPTREALVAAVRTHKAGDKVRLKVQRDGKERFLVVTLGERPAESEEAEEAEEMEVAEVPAPRAEAPAPVAVPPGKPYLGLAVREADGGVRIDRVVEDGPAAAANVPAGVSLRAVDDHKIASLADLDEAMRALRPGQAVAIQVHGKDGVRSILVTPRFAGQQRQVRAVPGRAMVPAVKVAPEESRPAAPAPQAGRPPRKEAGKAPEQGAEELEAELQSLRAELRELRKQLEELRRQADRRK